jgi:hypothetical protein
MQLIIRNDISNLHDFDTEEQTIMSTFYCSLLAKHEKCMMTLWSSQIQNNFFFKIKTQDKDAR